MEGDLKEQLDKILPLDEQILADLVAEEDSTEDEVTEEITRERRGQGMRFLPRKLHTGKLHESDRHWRT